MTSIWSKLNPQFEIMICFQCKKRRKFKWTLRDAMYFANCLKCGCSKFKRSKSETYLGGAVYE